MSTFFYYEVMYKMFTSKKNIQLQKIKYNKKNYISLQVQNFRFLCPNGTAFDQEAQICADWGDVDCEAATLYYSSDNFDLYRIGSGFESKRAPFAEEEEEATFHLQRAETGR